MISYKPLWKTLIDREVKKIALVDQGVISRGTLAKLSKNESVRLDVIDRLCQHLGCQIQDVVECTMDG